MHPSLLKDELYKFESKKHLAVNKSSRMMRVDSSVGSETSVSPSQKGGL